ATRDGAGAPGAARELRAVASRSVVLRRGAKRSGLVRGHDRREPRLFL
ncbi:MAG: hypothetical protein AVDCRST_MAG25-692, partial [uncultured Rubrobacteraceae bacterium]